MSDPLTFDSATPRHALPLLFPGQAQKEFYVNEAHALIDALLHCAVEGVANAPPTVPDDGACWLIGAMPTGAWAGQAGNLACRQLGNWLVLTPREGLACFNRATGQVMRFVGGTTIDTEMRTAFTALTNALAVAGIFATL
jgi:hypothetical protein